MGKNYIFSFFFVISRAVASQETGRTSSTALFQPDARSEETSVLLMSESLLLINRRSRSEKDQRTNRAVGYERREMANESINK